MSASAATAVVAVTTVLGAGYVGLGHVVRRVAQAKYTVLDDLPNFGKARERKVQKTAVICGGSIAGLLAARVCSDHFENVIVIDPDNDKLFTDDTLLSAHGPPVENGVKKNPRSRVFQYVALHIYQAMNLIGLERLFPGFRSQLISMGVPVGPGEGYVHFSGVFVPAPYEYYGEAGIPEWFQLTRPGYEALLRKCVKERCENVKFVSGTVNAVLKREDDLGGALRGVTYREGKDVVEQEAELVVDCTGATHAGLTWLAHAGYPIDTKAIMETYRPNLRATNCEFPIDPAAVDRIVPGGFDKSRIFVRFTLNKVGDAMRYLSFMHFEDNKMGVLAGGNSFPHKIHNVAEIRDLLSTMDIKPAPEAWYYELLDYLESVQENATFLDYTVSSAYHINYHSLPPSALPSNYVALGDAVAFYNPIYGVGLTKSMIGAISLDSCLRKLPSGEDLPPKFGFQFFKSNWDRTKHVWQNTKHTDYGVEVCETAAGESRAVGAFERWWQTKLLGMQLRGDKDDIRRAFQVKEWLAPPTVLFAPSVVAKVVVAMVKGQ